MKENNSLPSDFLSGWGLERGLGALRCQEKQTGKFLKLFSLVEVCVPTLK